MINSKESPALNEKALEYAYLAFYGIGGQAADIELAKIGQAKIQKTIQAYLSSLPPAHPHTRTPAK